MRFLFVDRLLQLSSSEASVRGLKHITSTDAYLCPDLKGRLCFMPAIIGETLGQLTAWSVMAQCDFRLRPVAGIVAEARVYRPAYVGETWPWNHGLMSLMIQRCSIMAKSGLAMSWCLV